MPEDRDKRAGRGNPARVRGMDHLLQAATQMGRALEQLWRLRRCQAGTRGLVPDFSHPLPTATFVILSSPSTFLFWSFCTNLLSV